jgi:hypothetical protein
MCSPLSGQKRADEQEAKEALIERRITSLERRLGKVAPVIQCLANLHLLIPID